MTAVSNGVYDLTHTSPSFYGTALPEGNAIQFAVGECKKYRDAGAIPLLDQVHRERTKTMLLGCSGGGHGFVFITKDSVESLDYFKGKKMRATALYSPILQALGASPVEVAPAEVYTALERRVVDGVAWPEMGIKERKLQEVLKYMVKPTWLEVRETMVMNVNSFNRLPPHLQKAVQDTALEMESEYDAFFRQTAQKEQAELQQEGMQIITLPKAEGDKLQQVVSDATWGTIVAASPEWGPKLREAFTKAAAAR
jgi:TRAP-type C4-dicarboxylate transport system substrate-binding protein